MNFVFRYFHTRFLVVLNVSSFPCIPVRLPYRLLRTLYKNRVGANSVLLSKPVVIPKLRFHLFSKMESSELPGPASSLHTASVSQDKTEEPKNKKSVREQKRKLYKCGQNFKTLDSILTCEQLFAETQKPDPVFASTDKVELASKISLWQGDITTLEIDAIVNAANASLLGGGGVDGAIHRAAGKELRNACAKLNGCATGNAKITEGFNLPSKFVIHTVGPMGQNDDKLWQCYKNSLQLVIKHQLRSVAFPCISTGIYGFPAEPAAHIALDTVKEFLVKHHSDVDRVIFCVFMPEDVELYRKLIPLYFHLKIQEDD